MALANYTDLKAAIASWLHRGDLNATIPDFITLAESEINTELRTRLMEADESLTLSAAARTVALPSRYIEPIALALVVSGQPDEQLTYRQPQQLPAYAALSARPQYWTVNGANIEFPNLADQEYTLTFRMLKGFDLASTATNTLMTTYPGIYLFGALAQAAPYMVDDNRIAVWRGMYEGLKAKLLRKEGRSKALTRLVTELPGARPQSNILTG